MPRVSCLFGLENRMRWIEIVVTTNEEAAEILSDFLTDMGANGTEMVDPDAFRQVLENNRYIDYADDGMIDEYGTDVIIKAYFSESHDPNRLMETIKEGIRGLSAKIDVKPGTAEWRLRDDSEWKDNWKEYFKPFKFTEKIVIKPSWEEYAPKAGEIVIELDPGMAFGTGTHETTRMCALLGEKYLRPGDRVLDLGCGTAILALTAAKLGADGVLAVDIDDAAVRAAQENVLKNHESDKIKVIQGVLAGIPEEPFDLIYINIIADIIISLACDIRKFSVNGTHIILSGIIKSRRDEVAAGYAAAGFKIMEETSMGEWVAMALHA